MDGSVAALTLVQQHFSPSVTASYPSPQVPVAPGSAVMDHTEVKDVLDTKEAAKAAKHAAKDAVVEDAKHATT